MNAKNNAVGLGNVFYREIQCLSEFVRPKFLAKSQNKFEGHCLHYRFVCQFFMENCAFIHSLLENIISTNMTFPISETEL